MRELLEQDGPLQARAGSVEYWEHLTQVEDGALWRAHVAQKRSLAALVLERTGTALGTETLVMGFARRFATYKRATLLLRDLDALHALLFDGPVPVSLVFAGKAHPADTPGQAFIAEVIALSRDPRFEGRVFFLENYDIQLGRAMTQGSDLWLSTSRRPHEASGTSGMKALLNGVLNCAVLDGWWDEAHAPDLGWAMGGDAADDVEAQDAVDHRDLLALLTQEVLPLFAERNEEGIPLKWVERMRTAMIRHGAFFTSARMVQEYSRKLYAKSGP
jgi:starch phosphorylase